MATSILDLVNHVQQQGELGRARGKQSALAKLAGQALTADPMQRRQIVGQAMQVDPDAGFALNRGLQQDDTARNQKLGQMAATLAGIPEQMRAGMFRQIAPELRQMGLQVGDDYLPEYDQVVQQIAKTYGESVNSQKPAQQQYAEWLLSQVPEGDRAQALGVLAGTKARPATGGFGFEIVTGADGIPRMSRKNPRTGAFEVYNEATGDFDPIGSPGSLNGDASAPQVGAAGNPFAFLGSIPGITVTSGFRTPEHNARVNGVPNSFHLTGQARDILPPTSPQLAALIRQQAEANGLEVIDEGDHWHLEPRGRGNGPARIAIGRRPEDEEAAKEIAKQQVQLGFLPQVEAVKTDAAIATERGKQQAQADVELAGKRREKQTAYDQYVAAMSGVENSLKNTTTNPVAGRLPALTANQQIAEGAVAASAPVLKQLFRSAGEGVFTDKDQELLIAMLPTRKDHPEARKAKLANIDAIVRAKLGIDPADAAPNSGIDTGDYSSLWGGN